MKMLRRVFVGLGVITGCAMVLQLAAPRTVHGVVTTLVSVVGNVAVSNPASGSGGVQPLVVQDAEVKALQPYRSTTDCLFSANSQCTNVAAQATGTQVLVINDVSGFCTLPNGDFMTVANFNLQTPDVPLGNGNGFRFALGGIYIFTPQPGLGSFAGGTNYTFGRQTYIVLDTTFAELVSDLESASPSSAGSGSGTGKGAPGVCTITTSGYYVHL